MSGEAMASLDAKYFRIQYGTGMTVSVAMPPNVEENPHYISDYFKSAERPLVEKLNRLLPDLNAIFEKLVHQLNFPIIVFDAQVDYSNNIILEDHSKDSQTDQSFKFRKETTVSIPEANRANIRRTFYTKSAHRIHLYLTINRKIKKSQLIQVEEFVLELFNK